MPNEQGYELLRSAGEFPVAIATKGNAGAKPAKCE